MSASLAIVQAPMKIAPKRERCARWPSSHFSPKMETGTIFLSLTVSRISISLIQRLDDKVAYSAIAGFNIPMQIKLSKTTAECPNLTCSTDILKTCPKQLLDFGGSVCSSACKKKLGEYSIETGHYRSHSFATSLALGSYKNLDTGAIVKGDRNCCTGKSII